MKKYLLAILFIVVIVATVFLLKNRKTKNVSAVKSQTTIASTSKIVTKTITILPIGDNLSARFITDAFTEIKKYIPSIGLNTFTKFPASAYYKPDPKYCLQVLKYHFRMTYKSYSFQPFFIRCCLHLLQNSFSSPVVFFPSAALMKQVFIGQ